jgi:hypothetical protein
MCFVCIRMHELPEIYRVTNHVTYFTKQCQGSSSADAVPNGRVSALRVTSDIVSFAVNNRKTRGKPRFANRTICEY